MTTFCPFSRRARAVSAHGWLAVPLQLLHQVGVAHLIRPYSCADADTAYLEEDEDELAFLDAAEAASWHVETTTVYVDGFSPIRNLPRFKAGLSD